MANLADQSGDAASNIVQGKGTASLSFPMPGTVPLNVESVVATIDNSAGGATTPTLVVRDSSGEVIATKRMDDTIPAGGSGTATFSLRNSGSAAGIRYHFDNEGDWLLVRAAGANPTLETIGGEGGNWGIALEGVQVAFGSTGNGAQTWITSTDAVQIQSDGGIELNANDVLNMFADHATVGIGDFFALTAVNDVSLEAVNGEAVLAHHNANVAVNSSGATVRLEAGQQLAVVNRFGNTIFEVRENGGIHGLAAVGAIVWDL